MELFYLIFAKYFVLHIHGPPLVLCTLLINVIILFVFLNTIEVLPLKGGRWKRWGDTEFECKQLEEGPEVGANFQCTASEGDNI